MMLDAKVLTRSVSVFACCGLLTACEQTQQPPLKKPPGMAAKTYEKTATVTGTVSDNAGPLKTGFVTASTEQGQLLTSTELKNTARYQLNLPAGASLPIILTFSPTADSPEADKMLNVATHVSISHYDINPLTTLIAKKAKAMGGYTHSNMVQAAENSVSVPAANKTTAGFRGDPTTQYGGWH